MTAPPAPEPEATRPPPLQRRQPRILTQTITRPSTTFTTSFTLGGPDPSHFEPQPQPQPTTEVIPQADTRPEPTDEAPEPTIYGSDGSLSSAEIGAILGSIIAFVALLLVVWQCMVARRLRAAHDDRDDDDDDASSGYMYVPTPRPPSGADSDMSSSVMSADTWRRPMPTPPVSGLRPPARPTRAAPRAGEVNMYSAPKVAYGRVRHDTRPQRTRPP